MIWLNFWAALAFKMLRILVLLAAFLALKNAWSANGAAGFTSTPFDFVSVNFQRFSFSYLLYSL